MARVGALLCVFALLLSGCPGGMTTADSRTSDHYINSDAKPVDNKIRVDYPVTPGAPCLSGACGANLICMANECLKMCPNTTSCGDKVSTCSDNETCLFASSFTNACYPATRKVGESCGGSANCVQGTLCVSINGGSSICLALCKYGCPTGTQCGSTTTGCQVCVPS